MVERAARSLPSSPPVRVRFDRFELDEANARLLLDGSPVALAPTPFALLCSLVRQPGALLTKSALLDEVWGHQFVSESVLKTVISEVRTTLKDDARQPRFIETVSRRGYRFIAPVAASTLSVAADPSDIVPQPSASFIGRREALARLRANWALAGAGRRRIVWLAGEPGIGKTTLIQHFIAGLGGIACIRGQCVEQYGTGESYLPVLEAISELCRRDTDAVPLLRSVAPTWLLQLPWLNTPEERDAIRRELAGVSPDRMLREMGELLDRYTERTPLLLVTEDLHWSDRATIQLIDSIARRHGSARLMWLASFRLAEVVGFDHPLNRLRHELRLHELCEEIVLDSFSESEVAEYVAERSQAIHPDEAFVRALHERTDGLPLFVASVMNDLIARAEQEDVDAVAAEFARMAVPENLAAIIDHYIARLDTDERVVLEAAAVCGADFRVSTVSTALDRDADSVGQVCGDLAREQRWLVRPRADDESDADRPYSFRHALFRDVLYQRTAPSRRVRLHCQVAVALEHRRRAGEPINAAELASHFERGRQPLVALRYYTEAAEDALAHLSPSACMSHAERGLALLRDAPEGMERKALEISLATLSGVAATHVLGMVPEAKRPLERAYALLRDVPQHPMLGRLLQGLGFLLALRTDYAEALAVAERAEALSSEVKDPALVLAACIVHGDVDQRQGRSPTARIWIERGLAAAKSLDIAVEQVAVADSHVTLLGMSGVPLLHLGFVEQAHARLQQAHARADALKQPMARMVATWYDALVEVRLGNAERVASLADDMRRLVEEFSLGQGRTASRWFRGWADARMGKPLEGYRLIREAYEESTRVGMLAGGSEVRGYAVEALLLAGDRASAERELKEALQFANDHAERVYLPQLLLMQAAIARSGGDAASARASVRRAVADARTQEAPWLELMALVELCEHDPAARDRQAMAAVVGKLPEAGATALVARARALLGKPGTA